MKRSIERVFTEPERQELRSGWQVLFFFALAWICILALGLIYGLLSNIAGAVVKLAFGPAGLQAFSGNKPLGELILRAFMLAGALIASAISAHRLAHRSFASVGYGMHRGWVRDLGIGVGAAFVMVSMVALLQWLGGGTRFVWQPPPLRQAIGGTVLIAVTLFVAASLEEVLFRGFPLQALAKSLHPVMAALIMSVPFGLIHVGNPCHTIFANVNTVFAGIWLSAAYFKTRSLWLATGLHVGWNFCLGSLYGLTVSGVEWLSNYSLFHTLDRGPLWLTGGCYGPEGGAAATLLLALCTIWLLKTEWLNVSPEMAGALHLDATENSPQKYGDREVKDTI